MQVPLAIVNLVTGTVAWLFDASLGGSWGNNDRANIPVTMIAVMPTNQKLLAARYDLASNETRLLLE